MTARPSPATSKRARTHAGGARGRKAALAAGAAQPTRHEDDDIVCACVNMTKRALGDYVLDNDASFEELLAKTGAGQRCTACLLDLEYLFTSVKTSGRRSSSGAKGAESRAEAPDLLHRIYAWIDRISPSVPLELRENTALLAGHGVSQWLIVANDSLMFEGKIAAPPMTADIVVRDSEGRERHRARLDLPMGEEIRLELSRFLEPPRAGALGIGSVEIARRARRAGYRGTTRPQTLLEAAAGSCAVHTQAFYGPGDKWFPYYHQPEVQRFFVALVNGTRQEMGFEIGCFREPLGGAAPEPVTRTLSVPPLGARLHEVELPDEPGRRADDGLELVRLRCRSRAPGNRKIMFICASRDLDRFSIDHPGP